MSILPIPETAPRGWTNPITARDSAALAAAGAWDAAPIEFYTSGAHTMRLQFTYTRGAAGGAFDFQVESSIYAIAANVPAGAGEWADPSVEAVGAVAAGADTQSLIQDGYDTFTSQGAAAETFTYGPVQLNGTVERVRVPCRESGVVGTPGTLAIVAELF
jgi:hypothetical protein